jgi:hypothetical protein
MKCIAGYNAQVKEIFIPAETSAWCEQQLSALGETLVDTEALRVEASHRSFYRLHGKKQSFVLMQSPPELERNEQFVTLARLFHGHGIRVPEILAIDKPRELFLLADLGDIHLEDLYGTTAEAQALSAAIDILPTLAGITDPAIEPYTTERLYMELEIFSEWFVQGMLKQKLDPGVYQRICDTLVHSADMQPKGCVHRDFHCRNLLFVDGKLGVVDFQDALHGPILYDIASLLRDCYFEFKEAKIDHWLTYFVSKTSLLDDYSAKQVKIWFDWIAIQRQLKAIGIFARLHLRDHKSTHLAHIPTVLGRLLRLTAQYPELEALNLQLLACTKHLETLDQGSDVKGQQ